MGQVGLVAVKSRRDSPPVGYMCCIIMPGLGLNLGRAPCGVTKFVTPTTTEPTSAPENRPDWGDLGLVRLSAYGFGVNGLLLAMDVVILPALLLVLASDHLKNTYLV